MWQVLRTARGVRGCLFSRQFIESLEAVLLTCSVTECELVPCGPSGTTRVMGKFQKELHDGTHRPERTCA